MSTFTDQQISDLKAPLPPDRISERSESGRTYQYIEGWQAIWAANDILGYDGSEAWKTQQRRS